MRYDEHQDPRDPSTGRDSRPKESEDILDQRWQRMENWMQKSPMVQSERKNWKRLSEVLCDRKMNVKINGKYRTVVRPALVHEAETLALNKVQEKN